MVAPKKKYLTKEWYEKLLHELKDLKEVQLPFVLDQIKEAQEAGDLSENSEYHSAKEKQALMNARIIEIERMIDKVEIVDESAVHTDTNKVEYGSHVTIQMEDGKDYSFQIVGSGEVEVSDSMKISFESPIGSAVEWKKKGDKIRVKFLWGKQDIVIKDIS